MKKTMKKFICMLMVMTMIFGLTNGVVLAEDTVKATALTTAAMPEVEQVKNVIDILTVNDFHGNVTEKGKEMGMAKMVGYVNDHKAVNPNTLVVSAGDSYQGTAISNLTQGAPVSEMYKGMGVVASAVGNHEFDWGVERINTWSKDGGFPFLAANIVEKSTGEPVAWAKPYLIQEVAGKKIAFIGLTTVETAHATKAENVATLEFVDAGEAAAKWVEFLKAGKAEEGTPDVILALTHISSYQRDGVVTGSSQKELENITLVDGIDGIITGHSHQRVAGTLNDVPVLQAYKNGRSVGKMSIVLNDDQSVKEVTVEIDNVYKNKNDRVITEDEATKAAYTKFDTDLSPILDKVVGKVDATMEHSREANVTPLGNFTADIMRKATGVQIGITNGGGLREPIPAGNVTMGTLYAVMPYDNTLVTMNVTGEHLKAIIDHGINAPDMGDGQFAGLKVVIDPSKPYESKVISMSLEDGTPIEMDKTYSIVINDFMYPTGDKYDFKAATDVKDTFVPIRDELVNAFKNTEMVKTPSIEGLVVEGKVAVSEYIIKAGDVLWKIAQAHGLTYQELAEMNNIDNPHLIFAGATLEVPAK